MKKYFFVFLVFFLFGVFLVSSVYLCPDLHFLLEYVPLSIEENPDFLLGSISSAVALCFSFSLFLFPCLIWDFLKRKSSGSSRDQIKED